MLDIDHFKAILERRRKELSLKIDHLEDRLDDPRDPDAEERAVEREEDEVLELQEKSAFQEIKAIDHALERIGAGTYGVCPSCEEPISAERLEAVPHAALCRNCMGE